MTQPFGHEKLIVYQKDMHFVGLRSALLDRLARRVAACDHLDAEDPLFEPDPDTDPDADVTRRFALSPKRV